MDRRSYPPGAAVFKEGEAGECAYVIAEGEVQISALRSGREVVLATLGAGELFGEMALLDGQVRSATATAVAATTLVVVHRDQVERLVAAADPLLNLLLKVLLERLRMTNSLVGHPGSGEAPRPAHDDGFERLRRCAMSQLALEQELRQASTTGQFVLLYQPIVAIETGLTAGFEALLRWNHPHRGLVSPGEFVPLLERSGMVIQVGRWVIGEACGALCTLQQAVDTPRFMGINLSPRQMADPQLVGHVEQVLQQTGVAPEHVKLEVTESVLMDDPELAVGALQRLKALGVTVAIDDFGTGYSSLSYLRRFPIDVLKIDRSFVATMLSDSGNLKIVRAIVGLARELGMSVIAEGVERPEELSLLRELGCQYAQGYLFSRPMPLAAALDLVRQPLSDLHPAASPLRA